MALRIYKNNRESITRYRQDGTRGRNEWTENGCNISVTDGYHRDTDSYITDILVIPLENNPSGAGLHVGLDEDGHELFRIWRDKR